MKFIVGSLLVLTLVSSAWAGISVDSIVAQLNDHNLPVLHDQLARIFDHRTLGQYDSNRAQWPVLRYQFAKKIEERTASFSPEIQVAVEAYLAEMFVREQQFSNGYPRMTSALQHVAKLRPQTATFVYLKASEVFRHLTRLDSAIWYAEKAIVASSQTKNDSLEKSALDQVALLCYRTKNYVKAEYYFKKLDAHSLKTPGQSRDYNNTIGLTFRNRQMYDSAIFYFEKTRKIAEQLKDTLWLGLVNGNIGYVYFLQKQYDRALPGLLLDLGYSMHGLKNYKSAINALSTLTTIYTNRGEMAKAKFYYDSLARNISRDHDPMITLAFLKTSADYFEKSGDTKKAAQFLRKLNDFNDSLSNLENLERAHQLQAQFDFDRQLRTIETLERQTAADAAENRLKNYLLIGTVLLVLLAGGFIAVLYRSNQYKHSVNTILGEQAQHLNHLNETKDKLFSIISHDLRGPINSLKAMMGMLTKGIITPEEFKHFFGKLQDNVEHVHFTLENVLYWSRSQMQGMEAKPELITLDSLVNENVNLFSEPIRSKGITVKNQVSAGTQVVADPNHVRLVLRNLIANAVKFTDVGGTITVSSKSENGSEIISVADTGVGIREEVRKDLFTTHSKTTVGTHGEKGTGLGLSLCKEMVEKNKGIIWVESPLGHGAIFKFSLPKH